MIVDEKRVIRIERGVSGSCSLYTFRGDRAPISRLTFRPPHFGSRFQGADLLRDRRSLLEGAASLAEPAPRIGLVAFHAGEDAMRPDRKRGFLVHLHDLVR